MSERNECLHEAIANALWHDCDDHLECKTNDLTAAAHIILERMARAGYVVIDRECGEHVPYPEDRYLSDHKMRAVQDILSEMLA